jgi:hypothetical protein
MKKISLILLGFMALFLSIKATAQNTSAEDKVAQQLEGTIRTTSHRSSADGVLEACGLEFSEVKRDFSTKRGAPVTMVGSFYLRQFQGSKLVYNLKLGLFDGLGNTLQPVAPANAFISPPHGKAPKKPIRADSDTPGFALYVGAFDDDVLAAFKAVIEKKKLVVGFNRISGQQDVAATIDLTVVETNIVNEKIIRTRSNQPVLDFSSCVNDLLKATK